MKKCKVLFLLLCMILIMFNTVQPASAVIVGSSNIPLSFDQWIGWGTGVYHTLFSYTASTGNKISSITINYTNDMWYCQYRFWADGVNVYNSDPSVMTGTIYLPLNCSSIVVEAGCTAGYSFHCSGNGSVFYGPDVADQATVQQAKYAADAAKTSADAAKSSADIASSRTWYNGTYGGSKESVADIAGYIRNTQLPGIDTKIDNLTTTINNINSTMSPPTIQKVAGQNGATCTTNGTFYIAVNATSGRSGQLMAQGQVDGGAWTGWYNIPQSAIPVTLSSSGAHTITVSVKDTAGITSSATMTAFRI